jgi:hypothetical protein
MYKNFSINEKEKRQILEMHTSNGYKSSINEQSQTINKGGYGCTKNATHTVCSIKDNYGYVVRVFDNKTFDSSPNELPNQALFQAGGSTWQETTAAFENNKKMKLPNVNIPTPSEPKIEPSYDRQKPLRNF